MIVDEIIFLKKFGKDILSCNNETRSRVQLAQYKTRDVGMVHNLVWKTLMWILKACKFCFKHLISQVAIALKLQLKFLALFS